VVDKPEVVLHHTLSKILFLFLNTLGFFWVCCTSGFGKLTKQENINNFPGVAL
jgi:hypothetical protein